MGASIQGLDKLIKRLERMEKGEGVRRGVLKACRVVEAAAVENCPVDTGELQQSIGVEKPLPGPNPVGIVGTNKEYAPYVEMGTGLFAQNEDGRHTPWSYKDAKGKVHFCRGQEPQPFLRPALRDNEQVVKQLIIEGLMKDIGK